MITIRKNQLSTSLLIAAASLFSIHTFAQEQLWQSFTNMRNVKAMVSSPQGVWAATTGGVLLWDAKLDTFRKFTNTEGLRQNETAAIGRDGRGRIWIALATGTITQPTGLIDVYDPAKNTFSHIDDYRDRQIFDFVTKGDSMYIALDIGVSFYDAGKSEVKETYKSLGLLLPRATAVNALFIDGQDLWAATDKGIARTSLNLPNLLAPESWTNYTTQEGLPSVVVRGFAKFSESIVAATNAGVVVFNGQRWSDISGNLDSRDILQLLTTTENNKSVLYAATLNGVYRSETSGSWTLVGANIANLSGLLIDEAGTLWASTSNLGLYEFDRSSENWQLHEPDGPATNNFNSGALDQEGNLWCTSSNKGFQVYDGKRWYNYTPQNSQIWVDSRVVIPLANGERWVGTWGRGIYIFTGPLDALTLTARIDTTNRMLSTSDPVDRNYPAVGFMKQDDQGNIWICNYNAMNSNAIVARTPENQWVYFSTSEGLRSAEVTVLEIEKTITVDRIWIGTVNSGVSVLDYQGTLLDKLLPEPDDLSGELDLDDGLLGTRVTAIAQDREGYMWIGTDKGLNYWFAETVGTRYGLISDNVQVVRVDPRNNKWIGTSAGISVLSGEDNFTFLNHYTVENSPLVGNFVTSIVFNSETGDAWIGTTSGISRLRTPFTKPKPDLSQLTGYPNPFILDELTGVCGGRGGFRITNLAENTAVKIYNVAGELMRNYPLEKVPGAQICWDGRDESGQLVPSGVYLYVAFIEATGASAVGKVAVVRR